MQVESAERWVRLFTGPASALVVLLTVSGVLVHWINNELKIGVDNQQAMIKMQQDQIEIMREGQVLMRENQDILSDILESQREEQTSLRQLLFRNVDTPETP